MKHYSHQQIEGLLDKYMNGLTTPEEETALGDFFRTNDVPREWEDYRLMFDYFDRGMEGDLITPQAPIQPLSRLMGHRWWGIAAAAAITAVLFTLAVLRPPTTSTIPQQPATAKAQLIDTPMATLPEVEMQRLAVSTPPKSVSRGKIATTTPSRTRRLQAQNDSLRVQNERLQRELEDLRRRAFIIDMEANGFKAVMGEDGRIVFIDLEQKIEHELNHQLTNNIPEI